MVETELADLREKYSVLMDKNSGNQNGPSTSSSSFASEVSQLKEKKQMKHIEKLESEIKALKGSSK